MAVGHGDLEGVKSLLKRGADPNARNGLLFTPLYMASATAQVPAMEALIAAGAKVDASSPYGTALSFACMTGAEPSIKLLISRGADVNYSRVDGITPIALAARSGALGGIRELLAHSANVNAKDNDGATPLIYAAREGNTEAAQILIGAGAKVDQADSHMQTPLMYAAVNGHTDFVQMLLEKGAKPNLRDATGRTALMLTAAYGDRPDVVSALLKGGADKSLTDKSKRAACDLAASRGHSLCASTLGGSKVADAASTRTVRGAVGVSLKALEHSMLEFTKTTGCVSCHQEGLGRITTAAAKDKGFAIDPTVDRAQLQRLTGAVTQTAGLHTAALKDPEVMKQVPLIEIDEVTTAYSFILAAQIAHKQPATPGAQAMTMVVAKQQRPDGSWGFMLPRVPMQSSFFTYTALAVQALKAYGPKASAPEVGDRISKARKWMLATSAKTSEDRAFRLLGLKWAGATPDQLKSAADEILADQKLDGGWTQLPNLQSDSYATGQALYALHIAGGLPTSNIAYQKGVKFLLRTQDEDGTWFVNKRAMPANNYFDTGFPHGQSQYSSFNGTCWATLALLQTVDGRSRSASR